LDTQLQFWKRDDPNVGDREDIIVSNRTSLFCPPLSQFSEQSSASHGNGQVRGHTARLWPYSWVTAGVRVLNGRLPGDLSDTVEFLTREDSKSHLSTCYRTVIYCTVYWAKVTSNGSPNTTGPLSCPLCMSCLSLSVTLMYCSQTVRWTKVPLGTEVSLGPGDIVLDGDPIPPRKGPQQPTTFRPMCTVAERLPISATAELLSIRLDMEGWIQDWLLGLLMGRNYKRATTELCKNKYI